MGSQEDLGQVHISHTVVDYRSRSYTSWNIDLLNVRIVGEFTDEAGPYCEDQFLVFVTGRGKRFDLPFGACGFSEARQHIGHFLNALLEPRLAFSTALNSAVLWPPALEGKPLFRFMEVQPNGVIDYIIGSIAGRAVDWEYSEAVIRFLDT
jgi:hypothetical protein